MNRTQIQTTVLLLCIFGLVACQKEEGKKASRLRVNAQASLATKKEVVPSQDNGSTRLVDMPIDNIQVCKIATPKDCPSIRLALTEDGSFEYSIKDETGTEANALDLSLQNQHVVEHSASKENFSYTFNNNDDSNRGQKLVIVSATSQDNQHIAALVDFISYKNVRKEKLLLSEIQNAKEALASLNLKDDENVLLVTDANNANDGDKAKALFRQGGLAESRLVHQAVSSKNFGYQLENKVLKMIGANVYLHFILPHSEEAIDGTPELFINSNAISKNEYDVVRVKEKLTLRILNIELFKKVSDKVIIKYKLKT